MLEKIFGNDPRVKVINYLLIMDDVLLTKKQIALGSEIARSTLNTFFDDLLKLNIIVKKNNLYQLNKESELVKILEKTQFDLAEKVFNEESRDYVPEERINDEKLDEIFDEDYDFDIDDELNKLEEEQSFNTIPATETLISINTNEHQTNSLKENSSIKAFLSINNKRENISL